MVESEESGTLKTPRPKYSAATANRICIAIATTPRGLHDICSSDTELPAAATVYEWLARHPDFADRYARAREQQADLLAYELLKIASTIQMGKKAETKEIGRECSVCGKALRWSGAWRHPDGSVLCDGAKARKLVERKVSIGDMVERARLQVDALKWLAAKLAPKKYGDQLSLNQRLVDEQGKDRAFTLQDYDQMIAEAEKKLAAQNKTTAPQVLKGLPAPGE